MAIDKAVTEAPLGIGYTGQTPGEVAIDEAQAEVLTLENGDIEVILTTDPEESELLPPEIPFGDNLAEYMDDAVLNKLASDLIAEVDADVLSRKDWAMTYVKGIEVLGFNYEERSMPWEDACGVFSTILAEAVIRFQAESMSETFPAAGPVKTKILGEINRAKEEAAARVKEDMNYELTEVMVEYRPEHERMLYSLGLAGSAFKKIYFDPTRGRQVAIYVPAEDVIVPYGASEIENAERVTHIMRKTRFELSSLQREGFYVDYDLPEPVSYRTDIEEAKAKESGYTITRDDRYPLYEVTTYRILEGIDTDEIPKPYVITVEKNSNKVIGIRRNWKEDDAAFHKRQHFVHYVYLPGFGFYGLGLVHIIGGYARAGTSIIRQLVDAGTLSNLPAGFKTKGLRIKGDDTPIGPGEFRDVDIPSGALKDNVMPLPYKEPSGTLLTLLDKITEDGRRLGAISDMNISDMSANAPVGTTLALLERTLKPMAAVQARIHYAMKLEFKLLKEIIAEHAPDEYGYDAGGTQMRAKKEDYALVEVIPVSDPNSSTMAQRVVQYQAVQQLSQTAPQIYNLPLLHRQMIEVLGVKNASELVPMDDDQKPADPVSENMNALVGKPLKAFIYQDHQAHMAAHMAFMQDPMIMQAIGQNPMANQIMGSLQAHIAEHVGFLYRNQIEEKLGVSLPAPNEQMPEEIELQLSRLVADAGKMVTGQHQKEAAMAEAQAQAQDPTVKLEQANIQVKAAEVDRKAKKDQADAAIAAENLRLKDKDINIRAVNEAARIDATVDQADKRTDIDAAKTILSMVTSAQPQVKKDE